MITCGTSADENRSQYNFAMPLRQPHLFSAECQLLPTLFVFCHLDRVLSPLLFAKTRLSGETFLSRVNIVKRIKIGGRWKMFSIPCNAKGNYDWNFLQDHWSITQRLTVDLGLRYDFEHLPQPFRQDANNVSPRLGLAYQFAPGWVIRAGYGLFFDRYVLANLSRALQKNGVNAFEQVPEGDAATTAFQAAGGGPLLASIAGFSPSIYGRIRDWRRPTASRRASPSNTRSRAI
jgi:hypothetical protein